MTAEKKQYQEQKGEAEQFLANLKRQKDIQRDYALWQLRSIDNERNKAEDDLDVQNAELKKAQQAQVSLLSLLLAHLFRNELKQALQRNAVFKHSTTSKQVK